ncbi:MAG: sterol desaturase family protein [Alphaproteobacteria bacterium]|nr:sterol desaturase family protein [Alphaproteobacteria bacterium]
MWTRPNAANGWIGLGADLLILDLWAYVWHRLNHAWPLLWRFHQVHHRDEFLDATSAVRFHPGEVLISAVARAPIIILTDISFISVLAFETLVLLAAVFHHSNARLPPRIETALCIFVVTPSHHWVHHHAQRADTDSNYGTVLTMWDRLFGSLSATRRSPDMTIGVEGQRDAPLLALAALPFRAGSDQPARNTRAAT